MATVEAQTPKDFAKPSICNALDDIPQSPEVTDLAERICMLNLIHTSQLVSLIRKRLNLPDLVATASTMTPNEKASTAGINGGIASTTGTTAQAVERTEFQLTLEKFDPVNKAKVIKEIKAILPQLNLVEAKNFVESAPKLIKEKVKKEEAEKIKKTLEGFGATVTME